MGLFTNIFSKNTDKNAESLVEKNIEPSKEDYQKMVNAYFKEYGVNPPQVVVRENTVLGRKAGEDFYRIRKVNGRSVPSNNALALGEASDYGIITINNYKADESMGEDAPKFQQHLDNMRDPAKINNIIWHECRHIADYAKIGEKLNATTAAQFLELKHDQELSAFRESAFRELIEYKTTKNPKSVTEDNKFLLDSELIDFNSSKLSPSEIKLVTQGVEKMYADTKQGTYERRYKDALWLDWSVQRQLKGDAGYDEKAFENIKQTFNNYVINGQAIDVSPYATPIKVNTLMTYMVNSYDKIPFSEEERQKYGALPEAKISSEDLARTEPGVIIHQGTNSLILTDMQNSYKEFEVPDFNAHISSAFQYGVEVDRAAQEVIKRQKNIKIHNEDVKLRKENLPEFLNRNKAYQSRFNEEKFVGSKQEALQKMRHYETGTLALEILTAYGNGQEDQLKKISPNLQEAIVKTCPSMFKEDGSVKANMSLEEFYNFRQIVDKNLNKIAPSFEKGAEDFYEQIVTESKAKKGLEEQNLGVDKEKNSSESGDVQQNVTDKQQDGLQSLVESSKSGHNRILEMRKKLAEGHGDKFAMLNELRTTNAEKLREMRFASDREVNPAVAQKLRADVMQKRMAQFSNG